MLLKGLQIRTTPIAIIEERSVGVTFRSSSLRGNAYEKQYIAPKSTLVTFPRPSVPLFFFEFKDHAKMTFVVQTFLPRYVIAIGGMRVSDITRYKYTHLKTIARKRRQTRRRDVFKLEDTTHVVGRHVARIVIIFV